MKTIQIRGAPNTYVCQQGILDQLGQYLDAYGFQSGLVLHGEKSWTAAEPYFPSELRQTLRFVRYAGECSEKEIKRISDIALQDRPDFILGIGGGKVLDLAKAAAHTAGCDVILVPTLAATCAAWTPLSVIYDENGVFIRYVVYPCSPRLVLVEPGIILQSPVEYMRSGIGDTLAKWYEAESLTRHLDHLPIAVQIALNTAQSAQTILLEDSEKALQAMHNHQLSAPFLRVIEAIIMLGGMVGGFGDHYGRIAAAHSIHNGLTAIPGTHHLLHGEKVAYGILVQLALEKQEQEILKLLPFYQQLSLPNSLLAAGLADADDHVLRTVAERSLAAGESIHLLDDAYSVQDVVEALQLVESMHQTVQ